MTRPPYVAQLTDDGPAANLAAIARELTTRARKISRLGGAK